MGEQEPMEPFFFALGRELDGVFFVSHWEVREGVFRFKGRLLVAPERALKVLSERYAPYKY
ncbi:MAG: site-2 protease family protein, partial [Candidatus Methylomirabilales bacterium]